MAKSMTLKKYRVWYKEKISGTEFYEKKCSVIESTSVLNAKKQIQESNPDRKVTSVILIEK